MNSRIIGMSKQYWVWMNWAPARPSLARRSARHSNGGANGVFGRAQEHARRERQLATALKPLLVAQHPRDLQQRQAVQVEHGLGLRMIAGLHAVAAQAQDVATPIAAPPRMSPWIAIRFLSAAGDLHHGGVTGPRQQRAHGQARHVAIGSAAVGRG